MDDSPFTVSINNLHVQIFLYSVTEFNFVAVYLTANFSQTKCMLTFCPNVIILAVINLGDNVCDQMLHLLNIYSSDCILASAFI